MIDLSFSLGSITVTPLFWSLLIAFIVSSFSIWRRLKEDFKDSEIFETTLMAVFVALLLSRLLFIIFNFPQFGLSFVNWLALNVGQNFSLAGAFLGAILSVNRKMTLLNKNKWEVLDALVLPFFYFLLLGGIGNFLKTWNLFSLAYVVIGLIGIVSFRFLKKSYRSFGWYKSGKTGFLISIYCLFLSLSLLVLAFFQSDSLYLNRLLLTVLFLFSFGLLYYRSEREIKEDISGLWKRRKYEHR